jgi:hypothetical protein
VKDSPRAGRDLTQTIHLRHSGPRVGRITFIARASEPLGGFTACAGRPPKPQLRFTKESRWRCFAILM